MSYRVLALKYRPQTFQDVIGQTHVTQTLTNAIQAGRVAHAMLFSGPRGTGKTSIARILAKSMNCEQGPTPTPCNRCPSCTAITGGSAADVFEIDGASNNSVDQIRELRDNVAYRPVGAPHKIYIIDEVHMLSTAAFNALLKTLEEPPEHVLFIFATTEPHKIPVTILSRCQRHHLGRIEITAIAGHLTRICTSEGYTIRDESSHIIASEADGSIRDALSLLDRVLSSAADPDISHDHILNHLGIIDREILFDTAAAVLSSDGAAVLAHIARLSDLGYDFQKVYASLIQLFRNIQVVHLCGQTKALASVAPHDQKRMASMTLPGPPRHLSRMIAFLLREETVVRFSDHTRIALETLLLQAITLASGTDIDQILTRLDALARQVDPGTTSPPAARSAPAIPAGRQNSNVTRDKAAPGGKGLYAGRSPGESPSQICDPPRSPALSKETPPAAPSGQDAPVAGGRARPGGKDLNAPPSQAHPSPGTAEKNWEGFVAQVTDHSPFIGTVLAKSKFNGIRDDRLEVMLSGSTFELKRLRTRKTMLEEQCREYFGRRLTLSLTSARTEKETDTQSAPPARQRQALVSHPLVTDALNLFNGRVVDVQTD